MRRVINPRSIIATCALWVASAGAAYASDGSIMGRLRTIGGAAGFRSDTSSTTFSAYIGGIISAAMSLIGVIFVAQTVYAGYLWMTAAGEEEQITKAKHIIRRSIIGLAIVLTAWAITAFVLTRLYAARG